MPGEREVLYLLLYVLSLFAIQTNQNKKKPRVEGNDHCTRGEAHRVMYLTPRSRRPSD